MSLLDKIRKETEAPSVKVETRQDALIENLAEENKSTQKQLTNTHEDIEANLSAELASFPPIAQKKVGVRLEEDVLAGLEATCKQNKITIETFLEAAFIACQQESLVMDATIADAQARLARRKRAGTIRSILTKSQNLYKEVK
ncbi:hypothetical protein ACSYAD_30280 [Acaryochloris marina NIES-2412]|uniref:hypothetical protein n=1 Tax=Acaryochloris marina TaxID=155978 RepID=UPI004059D301